MFYGLHFFAGDLPVQDGGGGIILENFEECSIECLKWPRCKYWTFAEDLQKPCILKEIAQEEHTGGGLISGTYGDYCGESLQQKSQGHIFSCTWYKWV